MRVLFAGTSEAAVPALHALLSSSHDVVGVITRPDARAGRGRTLRASPVAEQAAAQHLPTFKSTTLRSEEAAGFVQDAAPDVACVVAFGVLVPDELLRVPRHGWVNLHFSVLPAWRGAAPVQHALMAGDTVTGASTFRIDSGLDTGPVFGTITEPVRADDTGGSLLERLAGHGAALLVATVDGLQRGDLHPVPQPSEGVSLAPKITVADARLQWHRPALALERQVRACHPVPGAWTEVGQERLKVWSAQVADDVRDLAPGQLQIAKDAVLIGTGSCALQLRTVQAAGRAVTDAVAWARGARLDGASAR